VRRGARGCRRRVSAPGGTEACEAGGGVAPERIPARGRELGPGRAGRVAEAVGCTRAVG